MKNYVCRTCRDKGYNTLCEICTEEEWDDLKCPCGHESWVNFKDEYTDAPRIAVESLPKLTVEALAERGIEWPEWANYAAVNADGAAYWYDEAERDDDEGAWYSPSEVYLLIAGKWDASDWQNRKIERSKKPELPEWCKVGAWVHNEQFGFGRIAAFTIQDSVCAIDWILSGDRGAACPSELKPAWVRPWTFEEAPTSIKAFVRGNMDILRLHVDRSGMWYHSGSLFYTFDAVREQFTQLDGSPCGVLEAGE